MHPAEDFRWKDYAPAVFRCVKGLLCCFERCPLNQCSSRPPYGGLGRGAAVKSIPITQTSSCYAVARCLRSLSGVQTSDYISSLCSDQSLQLLANPGGHSGAMFYITADERYIVKTVTRSEARLLVKLLPKYLQHLVQQPGSLITRFYGLHRLQPLQGRGKKVGLNCNSLLTMAICQMVWCCFAIALQPDTNMPLCCAIACGLQRSQWLHICTAALYRSVL